MEDLKIRFGDTEYEVSCVEVTFSEINSVEATDDPFSEEHDEQYWRDRLGFLEREIVKRDAALNAADDLARSLQKYNHAGAGHLSGWQDALSVYRKVRGL